MGEVDELVCEEISILVGQVRPLLMCGKRACNERGEKILVETSRLHGHGLTR